MEAILIQEINKQKSEAWINKGVVDWNGFCYCEQYLESLFGGEWSTTYEIRNRKQFGKKSIYYQEYRFVEKRTLY